MEDKIDIRRILAEQASEAETKRAMEILARPERDEEVIVMLADAVEFWGKRCEKPGFKSARGGGVS